MINEDVTSHDVHAILNYRLGLTSLVPISKVDLTKQ